MYTGSSNVLCTELCTEASSLFLFSPLLISTQLTSLSLSSPSLFGLISRITGLLYGFFLWFLFFTYLVPFKTFLVSFSSCARLNWQLACQFSSANHLSYRIVSQKLSPKPSMEPGWLLQGPPAGQYTSQSSNAFWCKKHISHTDLYSVKRFVSAFTWFSFLFELDIFHWKY